MISGECAFPPPLNHEIITDGESKQVKHGFKKTKSQRKSFLTGFTIVRCREIFFRIRFPMWSRKHIAKTASMHLFRGPSMLMMISIEHCLSPVIHVPRLSRDGLGNYVLSPRHQVSGIFRHDHDPEWVCLPILKINYISPVGGGEGGGNAILTRCA